MSSAYLLLLTVLASATPGFSSIARCESDPDYSRQVCAAIATFSAVRKPCDKAKEVRLRQQIKSLQVSLDALLRERDLESGCAGIIFQRKCYFLLDQNGFASMVPFETAEAKCREKDGNLAYLGSRQLYDRVFAFVKRTGNDFVQEAREFSLLWTGATYQNGQIFLDNSTISEFSLWSNFHPINAPARNRIGVAVATSAEIKGMFNALPSMRMHPLCEKNLYPAC